MVCYLLNSYSAITIWTDWL